MLNTLCVVAIGAALGFSGFFAVQHYFHVPPSGGGRLALLWAVLILSYAACYPIYRGTRRLVAQSGAASTPSAVARDLWLACSIGALLLVFMSGLHGPSGRPQIGKAQADTRAIADAIKLYVRHCSGLPAGDSGTDCPVATEPGGPYSLPPTLLLEQTNAQGELGGPFMTSLPSLPDRWIGAGSSYVYYILPGGQFLICAEGEGTGANSNGGSGCPK